MVTLAEVLGVVGHNERIRCDFPYPAAITKIVCSMGQQFRQAT